MEPSGTGPGLEPGAENPAPTPAGAKNQGGSRLKVKPKSGPRGVGPVGKGPKLRPAVGKLLVAPGSWAPGTLGHLGSPSPVQVRLETAVDPPSAKPAVRKMVKDNQKQKDPQPDEGGKEKLQDALSPDKPQPSTKKKKRKMGQYDLIPKKKCKAGALQVQVEQRENPAVSPEDRQAPREETQVGASEAAREPAQESGPEAHTDRPCGQFEYTELALECLDLKAQERLLSPQQSGLPAPSDATESDLAEELPLCCCRMETPNTKGVLTAPDQTCMAMESRDGMLSRCQKAVTKQEMMRPSNAVHLLVLCDDHRAGMVKHQCCPGCGLFCRAGTFMECRPYGTISHRFHSDCASVLKDRRFCPHCGEEASDRNKVVVPNPESSPSVPRSDRESRLPAVPPVASLPSVSTSPAVPQILRAKKSCEPLRSREQSPTRSKDEDNGAPKESLESILMALDDETLKPSKKVKYPSRQLYVSAKQGELQKVIHLLVEGQDPNFVMDGQSKRRPLHEAAAEGHQEVCHMLVQAGANLEMCDEDYRTPLMAACESNQVDTVKYLIRAGAAINHKDIMGFSSLHLAAKLGHYEVVEVLLSKASKYINCQDDGGWTPITWAIEYKHKEVFKLLLAKGADVNVRDKEQNVALHWAALAGCDDTLLALLEARGDLNAINIHEDTPLHVAARENNLECVTLLLSRGADVLLKNKEGHTPLECCVYGSKGWVEVYTSRKLLDARRSREKLGEQVLSRDISRGYEAVPIMCVNGVDGEPHPSSFKYIPESCVTSTINVNKDITHLQHCSCTDDCSSATCTCGQLSLRCWYDDEGRLPPDFCQREPPVLFECNHACSCWRTCRNRVVQNGLRVRLQLFRTRTMGWGVRAMQDIPQGTFVCEYVGEIITDGEADKRDDDSFLFTLDNKVGDVYCVDARLFGNISRFINHLCEPNLLAVRVFTMHQDLRFPRVAFFSSRDIKSGEQLGLDYGDNYWKVKRKYFSCQCGSVRCRHSSSS
ncbi:histone-lysine N-methyltransferase EHMT1a [Synchiropus picturatus]